MEISTEESLNNKIEEGTSFKDDSYLYLKQGYSTEKYKVEIKNLPKIFNLAEFKKLLIKKMYLRPVKFKIVQSISYSLVYVTFKCEEDRDKAISKVDGYSWKKHQLSAIKAKPMADPYAVLKIKEQDKNKVEATEAKVEISIENQVKDSVLAWWNIPYETQLKQKYSIIEKTAQDITAKIYSNNFELKQNFQGKKCLPDLEPVIPSPVQEKYRNKCEFSIGTNPETNETTVGFRLKKYKEGCLSVGPIDSLSHVSDLMKKAALAFQDYIRSSDLDYYDLFQKKGVWKQLLVRTTCDGQLLIVVEIITSNCTQDVEKIEENLTDYFRNLETLKVTSFYIKNENNLKHKFGELHLEEQVLGLKFRISPDAFFQVNIKAAEELFKTIGQQTVLDNETTLLDVCCGTGTIGLCLADKVGEVLGIEYCGNAVSDAIANAERNGLSQKCHYFCGKAEDLINLVVKKAKFKKVVAIVDPPRAGLHKKVLAALRNNGNLAKLIYVSCDAKAASNNFIDLGRTISKAYSGLALYPSKMIAIDLFPSTPHYELVIFFEKFIKNHKTVVSPQPSETQENA